MRIQQLIEGQKEQIAGLRPSAPVTLYYPTDAEGAARMVTQKDVPSTIDVVPSLKNAMRLTDIAVQFVGQGKNLEPPRMGGADSRMAARAYPDSYDPRISFALLQQRPRASYTGLVSPSNIDKIYVMQNGKPEAMEIERFLSYVVKLRSEARRG